MASSSPVARPDGRPIFTTSTDVEADTSSPSRVVDGFTPMSQASVIHRQPVLDDAVFCDSSMSAEAQAAQRKRRRDAPGRLASQCPRRQVHGDKC